MIVPIIWSIQLKSNSTVSIRGECLQKEGLPNMIKKAIEISCIAYCFNGRLYQEQPKKSEFDYAVSINLIFEQQEDANDFIEHLSQQ